MPRYACPVCGDPNGYPLWIGKEPPIGCPEGDNISNVIECRFQMNKARAEKVRRQLSPWAFDEHGNIRRQATVDGEELTGAQVIGRVMMEMWRAGYDTFTGLPYQPDAAPRERK